MTDPHDVHADAQLVLLSAFAGDGPAVVGAFDALVDSGGVTAAYDVAWYLAAATVGQPLTPGPWRLDFPDIEDASYDARWVARFLSAYANADRRTASALFSAADADGELERCLLTLTGSAVATMRRQRASAFGGSFF